MRKRSASHDLGTFPIPSPGASHSHGNSAAGFQKGWASERVPPPGRQIGPSAAVMTTFNSGRTVPSKWEDAERWICSPLNGKSLVVVGATHHHHHHQPPKRPKSKSGPIVPCTAALAEGGSLRSFPATSPFSTGVLAAESVYFTATGVGPLTVPDWPDLKGATNYCCPSPKISLSSESNEEAIEQSLESGLSRQRDVATQMSPRDYCNCSHSPSVEGTSDRFSKLEVRDVEVDKRATTTIRWSRKRGIRNTKNPQPHDSRHFYGISETAMDNSKWRREEAKITAWENLQKAKAEAAIRKLEMKLEKKRSATMDKIVEKLRTAEYRAHKMRSNMSEEHMIVKSGDDDPYRILRTPRKLFSFHKHVRIGSLSRLLMCRVF